MVRIEMDGSLFAHACFTEDTVIPSFQIPVNMCAVLPSGKMIFFFFTYHSQLTDSNVLHAATSRSITQQQQQQQQ